MKHPIRKCLWLIGAILIAMLIAFAANAGRMLVIDSRQPSDVIVVLAGETDVRPALALQLLDQGFARRVLIDVPAAARLYNLTQLELAEQYVKSLPHAESIGICPIQGLSTRDESHDVARCLSREAGTKILIVTSDFHTRRSLSVFQHELDGKFFSIAAAHDPAQFGARWWTHRQWAKTCLDEWLKMFWWVGVERWR